MKPSKGSTGSNPAQAISKKHLSWLVPLLAPQRMFSPLGQMTFKLEGQTTKHYFQFIAFLLAGIFDCPHNSKRCFPHFNFDFISNA